MGTIFIKVIEMSVAAAFLMLAVILLRIPLKKAPKWFMGVLWAIVALRLILPFQIEADFGLLPNIGGMIETYIYGNSSQVTEVVNHEYTPSSSFQSGWVAGVDENEALVPEYADEEVEYLPSEEITTIETASYDNMTLGKDLFIRLQMIWMFGGLLVLGYAVFSYISIKKKTRASIKMSGSDNAYICDEINTPFIIGVFKPVIYLPSGLDDETVRNVLAHEKAHILRRDHLRKQFGFLLLSIHWFNPLVWISYALFCKDIELSCDEKVISHMSLDEKKSYATSLLLCSTHRRFVLAYPLAFGEVGVGTRVKQIFNYKKPTFWLIVMLAVVCAGLSTCFFTSVAGDGKDGSVDAIQNDGDVNAEATNGLNIQQTRDGLVKQWCEDFLSRNAEGIVSACTEEVQQTLIEEQLLMRDEDGDSFGWSSPWPGILRGDLHPSVGTVSYSVLYDGIGDKGIEIIYRAMDSEPHLYLWKEYLGIDTDENGDFKVTAEEFKEMTDIETADDFMDAYYNGINPDEMDYSQNGLGEDLNRNAKGDTNGLYTKLFDPASSARHLLNLSEDESKVAITVGADTDDGKLVTISFVEDNISIDMLMIQPWGSDGIYIPVQYNSDSSEGWNSTDDEVSYVIEDGDGERIYSNGNGNSTELPNYIKGSGEKFINLPFSDSNYYFENAHEHKSMVDGYAEEADLNGDGKQGHADTFGYVLLHLSLNEDGTWSETPEFVTDFN